MGISRATASKGANHYRHHRKTDLKDRLSRPGRCSSQTPDEVVELIAHLQREHKYSARLIWIELSKHEINNLPGNGRTIAGPAQAEPSALARPRGDTASIQAGKLTAGYRSQMIRLDVKKVDIWSLHDRANAPRHAKGSSTGAFVTSECEALDLGIVDKKTATRVNLGTLPERRSRRGSGSFVSESSEAMSPRLRSRRETNLSAKVHRVRVSTVIFDLDGTLVDTIDLIVASFQHIHRTKLGTELDRERVLPWIGRTLRDIYAEIAPGREQELTEAYIDWNFAHLEQLQRDYTGMRELLAELRTVGLRIGIATAKRRRSTMRSLAAAGLAEAVDAIVTMEDTAQHKPSPEPILKALALLGAEAESAIYVGDAVPDMLAAKSAGVGSVAVTWGAGDATALAATSPDHMCTTVEELRALLLS